MNKSLYEIIKENIQNGTLKEGFSISSLFPSEEKIRFADGAKDGIAVYHMGVENLSEEAKEEMETMINLILDGKDEEAKKASADFFKKHTVISVIDSIQEYIISNSKKLSDRECGNLYGYAVSSIFNSSDINEVKFGMSLLEIVSANNDKEVNQAVRTFGLSDEFALFSIFVIRGWKNANEEIFNIAKNVKGWGRIHAVEYLEAENQEISDWLLKEGIKNYVTPEYSALNCYKKADVRSRLNNFLSYEDFSSIGLIIENLLSEGPVDGISAVENARDMLKVYIEHMKEYNLSLEDYICCLKIQNYADSKEYKDLVNLCNTYLDSDKCRITVLDALKQGEGMELAIHLKIDYFAALLECLENNFDENFTKVSYLMGNPYYADKAIEVFASKLPLEQMKKGPADEMGFSEEFVDYRKLIMIIQELQNKPQKGESLIITALCSPVINNRNMALRVLNSWVEITKTPLEQISAEIYETLKIAYEAEPLEDIKDRMKKLL